MIVILLLILWCGGSFCWEDLTPNNADDVLEKTHTAMIITRINNCSKCVELRGAFEFVKEKSNGKIKIYSFNVEKYPKFLKKYVKVFAEINRRPTSDEPLILFSKYGKIQLYEGPQEIEGFVNYLKEAPKIKQILTSEQKREFLGDNGYIKVLGYYPSADEINFSFKKVAHMYNRELMFGVVYKKKIAKTIGLKKYDQVLISKPLEKKVFFKPKKGSDKKKYFEDLRNFIQTNQECTICPVTSRNVGRMFRKYYNVMIGFLENYDSAESLRFLETLREVSVKFFKDNKRSDVSTIFSFTLGRPVEEYLKSIGLETIQYPCFLGLTQLEQKKHFFDRSKGDIFLARDLKSFVDDYFEDRLKEAYRTEDEPEDNQFRPVRLLTADNFDNEVLRNGRSSLIFLWREGCPYCEKLKPTEDFLGKMYQVVDDVMIGEFNIQKNTHNFEMEGVPAVYWFPNCMPDEVAGRQFIIFDPINKTKEEFVEFVEKSRCENRENPLFMDLNVQDDKDQELELLVDEKDEEVIEELKKEEDYENPMDEF